VTTSAGRLFDGIASLIGLHHDVAFEGQAAMALEFVADADHRDAYSLPLRKNNESLSDATPPALVLDWEPLIEAVLEDSRRGVAASIIAARFHHGLVEAIVEVAREVGVERVALSGGCFQNRLLSEWAAKRLRETGFEVLMHRRLPANDGGISFGQVMVAAARLDRERN